LEFNVPFQHKYGYIRDAPHQRPLGVVFIHSVMYSRKLHCSANICPLSSILWTLLSCIQVLQVFHQ